MNLSDLLIYGDIFGGGGGSGGSGLPVVEIPFEVLDQLIGEGGSVALSDEVSAKFEAALLSLSPVIIKSKFESMGFALVANAGMTSDSDNGMAFSAKYEAGAESFVLIIALVGGTWYAIIGA